MAQVTIGGNSYDVFADVDAADEYLNASMAADAWRDADEDTKARALVTATRWIMGECWKDPQPDPTTPVEPFIQACIELAGMLAATPTLYADMSGATIATDGGMRRMKAGSVEIEYFRKVGFSVFGETVSAFPRNIMNLIGSLLCDSGASVIGLGGTVSYGTDCPSQFNNVNKFGYTSGI